MTLSREQMLIEMGISPIWVLREPGQTVVTAASEEAPERSISSADPDVPQMPAAQPIAEAPRVPVSPTAISGMDWPTLSKQVAECRLCPLCQQRKQAVLGVGDLNPDWLFIGAGITRHRPRQPGLHCQCGEVPATRQSDTGVCRNGSLLVLSRTTDSAA